jgi:hypothetical protein
MALSIPDTVKNAIITDQKFVSGVCTINNKTINTIIIQLDGTLIADSYIRLATGGRNNTYYIIRLLSNPNNINIIIEDADTTFITTIGGLESAIVHKPSDNSATWGVISRTSNIALTSAGGTSLVSDGVGPDVSIKGLTSGNFINLTDNGTDLQIGFSDASFRSATSCAQGLFFSDISGVYSADFNVGGVRWDTLNLSGYNLNNFDILTNNLRYIGSPTIRVMVTWDIQGDLGANINAGVILYINGTSISWSRRPFFENDNGDQTQISGSCILSLSTNDIVYLGGIATAPELARTLRYANITIVQIG